MATSPRKKRHAFAGEKLAFVLTFILGKAGLGWDPLKNGDGHHLTMRYSYLAKPSLCSASSGLRVYVIPVQLVLCAWACLRCGDEQFGFAGPVGWALTVA